MKAPSRFLHPQRTIDDLKELRELTGDDDGAQRVAFTPTWAKARKWLIEKTAELPVESHTDAAGNLWFTLPGASEKCLLIGGHIDSVPNGGWLDGCLNLMAGVEIMRRIHTEYEGKPPVTIRLVDWADEEGARFGKSLFGSSAFSGHLNLEEARALKDRDGVPLPTALAEFGIDLETVKQAGNEAKNATAIKLGRAKNCGR
jgi:N-carbamoyl-L-amino-acid hydrolase